MAKRAVAQAFPGATALTMLDVYDWIAPDGLPGGSAHVHLASAEGYVVLAGRGRLQTLGAQGYAESELGPGAVLWFTPGVIHRLVNEGGLRLLAVMQNAGLPEAGDAVLTFPPEILADPVAYARAAAAGTEDAARRRRDLAIEGYVLLRASGAAALESFYAAAVRLASGRVPQWRERWQAGAQAAAALTGDQLDRIAAGDSSYLDGGTLRRGSLGPRRYGMCGRLTGVSP
jgi:mannose-6-phosphate isomerase-like protein (cupin superfamily)